MYLFLCGFREQCHLHVVSASLTPSVIHILVPASLVFVLILQHGNTNIQWTANSLFVLFTPTQFFLYCQVSLTGTGLCCCNWPLINLMWAACVCVCVWGGFFSYSLQHKVSVLGTCSHGAGNRLSILPFLLLTLKLNERLIKWQRQHNCCGCSESISLLQILLGEKKQGEVTAPLWLFIPPYWKLLVQQRTHSKGLYVCMVIKCLKFGMCWLIPQLNLHSSLAQVLWNTP